MIEFVDTILALVLLSVCLVRYQSIAGTHQNYRFSGRGSVHCAPVYRPGPGHRRNRVYADYPADPGHRHSPLHLSGHQKVAIHREVEPIVGYHASLMVGLILIVAATFVSPKFNLPQSSGNALLLPTAITLLAAGMFLLMARRNAIAMVLGYIVMENGIYLVGTSFSVRAHHIVEFGILLDVLAGVMIMAVILQNIKQAFDDVDTALLRTLKE